MEVKETLLKAYKEKVEVLSLTMEVPYERYADTLLRLFNNKRENKEILKLINYYDSNVITMHINLNEYINSSYSSREECIKHLKEWFISGLDIDINKVKEHYYAGYIYYVNEYDNNFKFEDGDKYVENYLILESI